MCLGFVKTGTGFVVAFGADFFWRACGLGLFWPGLRKPRFCFGVAFQKRVLFCRAAARQKETFTRQNNLQSDSDTRFDYAHASTGSSGRANSARRPACHIKFRLWGRPVEQLFFLLPSFLIMLCTLYYFSNNAGYTAYASTAIPSHPQYGKGP